MQGVPPRSFLLSASAEGRREMLIFALRRVTGEHLKAPRLGGAVWVIML